MSLLGTLQNKRTFDCRAMRVAVVAVSLSFAAGVAALPSQAMVDYDRLGVEEIALGGYGNSSGDSGGGTTEPGARPGLYSGGQNDGQGGLYGGGGGHYFNFLAPLSYGVKAIGYVLRIPIYVARSAIQIIQVPLSFLHHQDGYEG